MRVLYRSVLALLFLLVVHVLPAVLADAQQQPILSPDEDGKIFDADFDKFVDQTLREWHVPGLSIAVVDNGKTASKGYGYAVLPDQNATANTQYFTGSTTKAFTAAAVAQLIHSGNYPGLKWTSPINHFLRSDFVLEDDYASSHTTIEDALSHRSGLPRHDLIYGQAHDTPSSIVQRMRHLPLTAEPRTAWQYCNLMFAVMTDLIESLTGKDLESVLRENFWKPLGMSSTTFTIPSEKSERSRLARGYYWHSPGELDDMSSEDGQYVPDPYIDLLPISGAGATISTVNDYALWIEAWLNAAGDKESRNKSSPVTNKIVRDLVTPRAIILEAPDEGDHPHLETPPLYGLGWFTVDVFGEKIVAHSGGLTGFGTQLYLLPNQRYGIVTMGNTAGTSNDAGNVIGVKLLLNKIKGTKFSDAATTTVVQDRLRMLPRTHIGPPKLTRGHKGLSSSEERSSQPDPDLHLDTFAGLYHDAGYGSLNLTLSKSSKPVCDYSEAILEGSLYDRTWPRKLQFHHVAGSSFDVKIYEPHGLGDIVSGDGIVWEEVGASEAVFEFGLDGETVEKLGIELESEMVERLVESEGKDWREGMIWFDKV